MKRDHKNQLSAQNVCKVLIKKDVLAAKKAGEIIEKEEIFAKELGKRRDVKQVSCLYGIPIASPTNIIDVIASFNIERADDTPPPVLPRALNSDLSGLRVPRPRAWSILDFRTIKVIKSGKREVIEYEP